jgi:Kef-type K+ transport system membrane component KefB
MLTTTIGTIATGCAAIDDVVAWTLLGIVSALVKGDVNPATTIVSASVYVAAMLGLVRPMMDRLSAAPGWAVLPVAILVTVGSAYATEVIGIHAIFGAFIAGVCMPRRSDLLRGIDPLLMGASALLLPAFFVLVGLRTQLGVMHDAATWWLTLLIIALATVGKLGASSLAARSAGFSWRDAIAIGALLNTRGLVSLVALDLGRTLGVLSPALFTMFVLMAFVTTFATVPTLRLLGLRPL